MITLNDVLAAEKSREDVSSLSLQRGPVTRQRPTIHQSFREEQEREGARADKSPLVVWAHQKLHAERPLGVSKLTGKGAHQS